ncbi:MAG: hypothetical protein R2851_27625 [Caldilineaceae bacterium]
MKIKYLLLLAAAALTLSACRSEAHKLNWAGNDAFAAQEYDAAGELSERQRRRSQPGRAGL